ncbi:type 1 glutamine amidotransferase domain-containing protein [Sphaerisporangium viridialbum]|uniref:type 1 glutamine amidotransferase domain-containing protein n=1 Tax=Sphaerisporangium viridialbum TaxID=46189 RepID=UPI003C73C2BA
MRIQDARVVVLVENLYQELELWYPVLRLREAGAQVVIAGPDTDAVYASKIGYPARAEVNVSDLVVEDIDALVVPGGFSPEYLRRDPSIVSLVREMDRQGKTIAAICHAGWLLATAEIVSGRRVTSVAPIRDDLIHAGADYVVEPVVVDGNLITSPLPDDLPVFVATIIAKLEAQEQLNAHRRLVSAPHSPVAYHRPATLKNRAAGPGSANYRAYAVG